MLRVYIARCILARNYGTLPSCVRVRFAPSPTGFLHLGGLRTAFFNYLFARQNNGKFVLRLEDTDQKRIKSASVDNLSSMLEWTGLIPNESPDVGGPYGPYVQSQRLDKYQDKANYLLKTGAAYPCFCSETRLNILKREALQTRESRGYDNKCRHLEQSEAQRLLTEGKPYTIRFKIPDGPVMYDDIVFGAQTYDVSQNESDFIIMKSDGFPTYHFASIVDDHLMEISHVLRGTEWLISTPKHILLHQAFDWRPPQFAHLPLLMNSDGTKLSKRQESLGIQHFKDLGYSPDALLNFLAAAGGGFGKQEGCIVYDLDTLCSKFDLGSVNKGSWIVDLRKLDLLNHDYLVKQLANDNSTAELIKEFRAILKKKYGSRYQKEEKNIPDLYLKKILICYKDRMKTLHHLTEPDMEYLWTALEWNEILSKFSSMKVSNNVLSSLPYISTVLQKVPEAEFNEDKLGFQLREVSNYLDISYSSFMRTLRIVLTSQKDGPGVAEILEMLGKKRSLEKILFVRENLNKTSNNKTSESLA